MNQNSKNNYSPKNFIKGKITELIFDQMFRKAGKFTVIPFGYENTLPEIAQYAHLAEYKQVLDNIRTAPDFALVSEDKKEVFLVEVKYKNSYTDNEIKDIALKIQEKWKLVRLFLVTSDGFFFDSCTNIIKNEGKVSPLGSAWVSTEIQDEYSNLLKEFIKF